MVIVFGLLMVLVVPKLTELYVGFGAELPLSTRLLQAISDFSVKFWWLVILLSVVGWKLFSKWKKTSIGRHAWDAFTLKIPLLGPLQKQIILVEFTRTLGLLVGAGVHILDALNILVAAIGNIHYQEALKDIAKKVEKGFPLGTLFAQYPIFPPILAKMVRVGEETGKMDEALVRLSTYFERESDQTVKGLTVAIEPIIMVILGVGVGFIVFSIITPIYNLTSQFK
jgi:type II secretory pathway component PulF